MGAPAEDESEAEATGPVLRSLKGLKGTEIAIDGVVYDIADFDHPGGEVVKFFGGNDVTVQYKMIHPYHTGKHLEKMKMVGKVVDYVAEYKFDTPFEREVKAEVFKIVRRGKEFGATGYFFRAFCYIAFFFYMQYRFATSTSFFDYATWYQSGIAIAVAFGVAQAFIGLNVQHDANHGAASRKPWVNDLLGFGTDLIGSCKWNWMAQHWTHHAYTNHDEKAPVVPPLPGLLLPLHARSLLALHYLQPASAGPAAARRPIRGHPDGERLPGPEKEVRHYAEGAVHPPERRLPLLQQRRQPRHLRHHHAHGISEGL